MVTKTRNVMSEDAYTDMASQIDRVFDRIYETGMVIVIDAMSDKLVVWHNGQFYSVGTDAGFVSNDFDADLAAGRFVDESLTSHQRLLRYSGDINGWSTIAQAVSGCIANGSVMTAKNGVYTQTDTIQIPTGLDFSGSNMKNTRLDFSSSTLAANDYMLEIHHDGSPRSTETMSNVTNMTLVGNTISNGLSFSNRHWCSVKDFNIEAIGTGTGYYITNAWLNEFSNMRVFTCGIGFLFGQDCNAVTLTRCGTENTSIACVKTITQNNRGSVGLSFYGCDFEFGGGYAIWNTSGNILDFYSCYIGEHIRDSTFRTDGNGQCNVNGGVVFFGADSEPESYLVEGSGVKFKGVHVVHMGNGANVNYNKLFKKHRDGDSAGSSIGTTFEDCKIVCGVAGTVDGNPLGFGSGVSQCETQGYKFNSGVAGLPVTRNQNAGRVTDPNPTGAFGMTAEINKDWVLGSEALLVVVYRSTVNFGISVSQGIGNTGSFTSLGYAYASSGELKTYINPQSLTPNFTDTQNINHLEIIADAGARLGANDYIEIVECYYMDVRVRGRGLGTVSNLYKANQPFTKA